MSGVDRPGQDFHHDNQPPFGQGRLALQMSVLISCYTYHGDVRGRAVQLH